MCEAKKRGVSVPLTMSQTGIYLECAEAPETTKYNVFACCRLPKGTEKGRFTEAVRQAVLRNLRCFPVLTLRICRRSTGICSARGQ